MNTDKNVISTMWRKCDKTEKVDIKTRKKMERYLLGAFKKVRKLSKDRQMIQIKDILVKMNNKLRNQ